MFQVRHQEIQVVEAAEGNPQQERNRLDDAIDQPRRVQLEALQARLQDERAADKAAIFAAHQELLDDPDLLDIAQSALAKGKSADFAWHAGLHHPCRPAGQPAQPSCWRPAPTTCATWAGACSRC